MPRSFSGFVPSSMMGCIVAFTAVADDRPKRWIAEAYAIGKNEGRVRESIVFTIMTQDQVVGHSELEHGDPPMGVAFGRFVPAVSFDTFTRSVEPNIRDGSEVSIWNELSVVSPHGVVLECIGVAVFRYDFGEGVDYQVDVMGITSPPYEELFPHHVAAYARRFPPSDT